MLIDWFTVAAQVVNFLILMWLLKRFLYQPVLDAIDAREERLTQQMQAAQDAQSAAAAERNEYERRNAELAQQQAGLLAQATADAEATRLRLLEAARNETANLRNQWQEALLKEQQSLTQGIANRTRQEVFAITRKTLADLADTGLEARMVAVFIDRLQTLGMAEKVQMCTPAGQKACQIVIRSAFLLPPSEQKALAQTVRGLLPIQPSIRFELEPELLSGIELISNGHKLEWSIAEYLAALEASIGELIRTALATNASVSPPEPAHV
ncbi:hypothetical protein [Thiothrix sp.]|jgi:F-type H+-transporting ATPase subunit b|uniref:F0F1 ATP synthase subunit B family protein n=1 Tax=Thiothrix sp. TaxID=1032 RepID=UPI00257D304F|nr:hypothetical protein [Thiothrix sp.]